jgi:mRNA-degrading endonuclease YafQ of YafQ-DinJ toxin-antitoxin module
MKFKLYTTRTFERKLKLFLKKHPELKKEIEEKLNLLIENPFRQSLKTHKLKGKLENEFAIYLTHEYRILFILHQEKIYLTNIGSHEDVY